MQDTGEFEQVLATNIEKQVLEKGFKVALLGVNLDRASNLLACRALMFDGGTMESKFTYTGRWFDAPTALASGFRRFLSPVMSPPNFVATYGRGWQDFIAQMVPLPYSASLVTVDLLKMASCLKSNQKRPDIHVLMELYGIGRCADTESLDSPLYEDLLWGVIATADKEAPSWEEFFNIPETQKPKVSFMNYAFSEETLNGVPAKPGVYTMFDREGNVLYVGKAANLRGRISSYFRPAAEIPQKVLHIRERIHHFDCRIVGSELEALLVEQELIARQMPPVNVQRRVAEGVSRYMFPLLPVAVVSPSTERDKFEVFCLGTGGRCVQCRLSVRRPSVTLLAKCATYVAGTSSAAPSGKNIRLWDGAGAELACRYFSRFRNRLVWMELAMPSASVLPEALKKAVVVIADNPGEAAEFRIGAGDHGLSSENGL